MPLLFHIPRDHLVDQTIVDHQQEGSALAGSKWLAREQIYQIPNQYMYKARQKIEAVDSQT
jgi:hypothetical protein